MGIIEKQSKLNFIILGLAVFLGAFNNLFLFPASLSKEEWGLIRFFPTLSIIACNLALLGSPQILLRYKPIFYDRFKTDKNGLFRFNFVLTLIGLLFVLVNLFVFKEFFLSFFDVNAGDIRNYYNYIVPILVFTVFTELFSAQSRAFLFSVFQLFVKEIVHRLTQMILLLLLLFRLIDFELFFMLYSYSLLVNLILLVYFLYKKNVLNFEKGKLDSSLKKELVKYGGANFMTGLGATLSNRIDGLMITSMVGGVAIASNAGLEAIAIYSFGAYLVSLIEIPARAISNIGNSIIAKAWNDKNYNELNQLYKKTAINQMLIGGLFFTLIWSGIDELFEIIGKYHEAKYVVLILGFSKYLNTAFGSNGSIIMSSKFYRYAMYAIGGLGVVAYFLNLIYIPPYGIEGAAIATTIAIFTYNMFGFILLYSKSQLQPFTIKTLYLFLITLLVFAFANFIDFNLNPFVEIIIDSFIIILIYILGVYYLNVSSDINNLLDKLKHKLIKN